MKMYRLEFKNDFGMWLCSKHLPDEVMSRTLVDVALKKAVKQNPRRLYRVIEFNVLKQIQPSLPPLTSEQYIAEQGLKIMERVFGQ